MTTVVRESYPIEKLPRDLREGLDPVAVARVTIEAPSILPGKPAESQEPSGHQSKRVMTLDEMFNFLPKIFHSTEEVNAYVRAMRDE